MAESTKRIGNNISTTIERPNWIVAGTKNEKETIELYKEEKKGINTLMLFILISWGLVIIQGIMGFIGWVTLGLELFSMWRIIDGLYERSYGRGNKKEVRTKNGRK